LLLPRHDLPATSAGEGRQVRRAPLGRYLQRIDAKTGQRFEVAGALRPAFALVSSTQTTLNADLRGAIERALQPLTSILVFAPPRETLDAVLRAEKLPPDWLGYDANRRPFGVSAEVTPAMVPGEVRARMQAKRTVPEKPAA